MDSAITNNVPTPIAPSVKQNEEQSAVSNHLFGPLQVVAGAGSGKTTTIIYRAVMILMAGYKPQNILITTFTKKAANDIKEKLREFIGEKSDDVCTGTFHSICLTRIIKKYADEEFLASHNLTGNWEAIDDTDQKKLIRQAFKELPSDAAAYAESDSEGINLKKIGSFLSIVRSLGLTNPREYASEKSRAILENDLTHPLFDINDWISKNCTKNVKPFEVTALAFWERYTQVCRSKNAIDYDDILSLSLDLLRKRPVVSEMLSKEWLFIMLDEYQDTNIVQKEIMDEIARHHENICTVGDDKQSIYMFRGSNINVIRGFSERYPNARLISLSKNYRSTNQILLTANRIEEAMDIRLSNELLKCPFENRGNMPRVFAFKDDDAEAQYVVSEIIKRIARGKTPSQMAILYRNKSLKDKIEKELIRNRVEYTVQGDMSLFESKEVKDAIAMIRFIFRPWSSLGAIRFLDAASIQVSGDIVERNSDQLGITPYQFLIKYSMAARELMISSVDSEEERKSKLFYSFIQVKQNIDHILSNIDENKHLVARLKDQLDLLTNNVNDVLIKIDDPANGYPTGSIRKGDITSVLSSIKKATKLFSPKVAVTKESFVSARALIDDCTTNLKKGVEKSMVVRVCTDIMDNIKEISSLCDNPNTSEKMLLSIPVRLRELIAQFWECSMYSSLEKYTKTRTSSENDGSMETKIKNVEYVIDRFSESIFDGIKKVFEDKLHRDLSTQGNDSFLGDEALCMSQVIDIALDDLITLLDKSDDEDISNKVQLMTLHSAKGLEFDDVFLIGLSNDIMPGTFVKPGDNQYEEEKRLLYVGLTRARKELDITYPAERYSFQTKKREQSEPSAFIGGIMDTVIFKAKNQSVPKFLTFISNEKHSNEYRFDDYRWY